MLKASGNDYPVVFHIDNMLTLENSGCYICLRYGNVSNRMG